jgi:hypothetical protein
LSTATLLSKSNALSRSDFFKGMKGSLEFDGVEPPSVFKGF